MLHIQRQLRRFLKNRKGASAVEFALVALPFFALLYATFETGLVFFAQETLQTAVTTSARSIMTGQAQNAAMNAGQFKQQVCNQVSSFLTCSSLSINVQRFSSFSSVSPLNPVVNGNLNPNAMSYDTGGPGDIILVQAFYIWPVPTGPLGFDLTNMSGGNRLLQATAVFRNEPY